MAQDEYHIVVHVWSRSPRGEPLIKKRSPNKHFLNMCECTGGSALAGEESIDAAIREAREEVGIELDRNTGRLFRSIVKQHHDFPQHTDVWLFSHDCAIEEVVLQKGETCEAMWASGEKIKETTASGEFLGYDAYPYLDELLAVGEGD